MRWSRCGRPTRLLSLWDSVGPSPPTFAARVTVLLTKLGCVSCCTSSVWTFWLRPLGSARHAPLPSGSSWAVVVVVGACFSPSSGFGGLGCCPVWRAVFRRNTPAGGLCRYCGPCSSLSRSLPHRGRNGDFVNLVTRCCPVAGGLTGRKPFFLRAGLVLGPLGSVVLWLPVHLGKGAVSCKPDLPVPRLGVGPWGRS